MDPKTLILWLISTGGGAALISWGMIKAVGNRWLVSQFERKLQELKHEHDRGIEDLRLQASQLLDRFTRFSAEEFKALPKAWGLVFDVYVATSNALSRFGRFLDFDRSDNSAAHRYAAANDFQEWEIEELLGKNGRDRHDFFHQRYQVHQIANARKTLVKANVFLARNALFIEKDVQDRLIEFTDTAFHALSDWEFVLELRGEGALPEMERADDIFRVNGEANFKALEAFVRERFNKRNATVETITAKEAFPAI